MDNPWKRFQMCTLSNTLSLRPNGEIHDDGQRRQAVEGEIIHFESVGKSVRYDDGAWWVAESLVVEETSTISIEISSTQAESPPKARTGQRPSWEAGHYAAVVFIAAFAAAILVFVTVLWLTFRGSS